MGVIVATPTAGSAGVLPGVLLALRDERGFSHDQLREGILIAAGLGYLIARNASVSGAEGGCQARGGKRGGPWRPRRPSRLRAVPPTAAWPPART